MEQGQLETETEAQYNARIIAGKKAVADAKANFNQASLKNEQAYAKSMGVLPSLSLVCSMSLERTTRSLP